MTGEKKEVLVIVDKPGASWLPECSELMPKWALKASLCILGGQTLIPIIWLEIKNASICFPEFTPG